MTSPILPLRAAIRAACLSDALLGSLMGGSAKVLDEPPRGEPPLYALFGDGAVRDWSDSSGRGHEAELSLVVWAKPGSAASALKVADRMADLLDDVALPVVGHRLVRLAVTAVENDRDPETNLARVTLRLRAVTEVGT